MLLDSAAGTSWNCPTCGFYKFGYRQDRRTVFQVQRTGFKGWRTANKVRHQLSGQNRRPLDRANSAQADSRCHCRPSCGRSHVRAH
eukprot:1970373-Amphidinium_carterae.1